nr:hypothetical protein [Tabrizicola sp.]
MGEDRQHIARLALVNVETNSPTRTSQRNICVAPETGLNGTHVCFRAAGWAVLNANHPRIDAMGSPPPAAWIREIK